MTLGDVYLIGVVIVSLFIVVWGIFFDKYQEK